jgi:ribosomal protein L30E
MLSEYIYETLEDNKPKVVIVVATCEEVAEEKLKKVYSELKLINVKPLLD